jgi:hypothetical protein
MARKRFISPGLWENEEALALTDAALRVWIGIWSVSDRNGVFEWRPRKWVFRFAPRSVEDPEAVFQQLLDAGFVARFEAQGNGYGFCIKWTKHQDPHIYEAPQFPMPSGDPRFTPCLPRTLTAKNAKWLLKFYGIADEASLKAVIDSTSACTDVSTSANTGLSPSHPSHPSCPSVSDPPERPFPGPGSAVRKFGTRTPTPGPGTGARTGADPAEDLAGWEGDDLPTLARAANGWPR